MGVRKGYKQTEVGVIPEDWVVVPLDSISKVTSGKRLPKGYFVSKSETPHPYIRVTDMLQGGIDTREITYVPVEAFPSISQYRIFKEDLFISVAGTLGLVGKIPQELDGANLTENANRITSISCDRDYLLHVLLSPIIQKFIESIQTVGAQPKLALTRIRQFNIPLSPAKAEQEAIAEALSDADALIASLEQLIAKKRLIKQGVMQELLRPKEDWVEKSLGNTAVLKARIGWQGLTTAEYLASGDYFLVTGTDFKKGYIDWYNCKYVEENRYKQDKNIQLKVHDVVVTKDGTIGKVALINHLPKPATLNSGVFVIRPENNSFYPDFFYYLLCSDIFTDFLEQLSAGSTINHLYQKDFVNFVYKAPLKIEDQIAIATVLSDMDVEISGLESKLEKARQLKQGMMQNLLTGQIRLIAQGKNTVQSESQGHVRKNHNWQINEAVIIGALTKKFGSEKFPLGRKRRTKLLYLLHRHVEQCASGYQKKAAGPYNPKTRYGGPEKIAIDRCYVREESFDKYYGFVMGDNVSEADKYFEQWYGHECLGWMEQFRYKNNDELELLTTVDMAMDDLRKGSIPIDLDTVRRVIREHPEWASKLEREKFSDENISETIALCKRLFDPYYR